eukprot:624953-Hanusia_phi.AAC.2
MIRPDRMIPAPGPGARGARCGRLAAVTRPLGSDRTMIRYRTARVPGNGPRRRRGTHSDRTRRRAGPGQCRRGRRAGWQWGVLLISKFPTIAAAPSPIVPELGITFP